MDTKKLTQEDMSALIDFGIKRADYATKHICDGDISIRPYYISGSETDNGCTYCEYKGICKNSEMENRRIIGKIKLEDIIGAKDDME